MGAPRVQPGAAARPERMRVHDISTRLQGALRDASLRHWVHGVLLVTLVVLAVSHQLQYHDWFIEDAAISFAYARNLAEGEGLVNFPGGERVEGYAGRSARGVPAPWHRSGEAQGSGTGTGAASRAGLPRGWRLIVVRAPRRRQCIPAA